MYSCFRFALYHSAWDDYNIIYLYIFILFTYLSIKHYFLPSPRSRHTSCHEMSYSKRETKLKEKKEREFSPLCPYVVGSAIHFHSLLSCTILLVCLTFKPPFLKQSTESIHLYHGLPTNRPAAHSPT